MLAVSRLNSRPLVEFFRSSEYYASYKLYLAYWQVLAMADGERRRRAVIHGAAGPVGFSALLATI